MSEAVLTAPYAETYRLRMAQYLPAVLLLYIAVLWPMLSGQAVVSTDIAASAAAANDASPINRFILPLLSGLSLLLLVAERRHLNRFHLPGLVVVLSLFGYLGMTTLWALAPSTTLTKLIGLIMQTLPVLAGVLASRSLKQTIQSLFWVFALVLLINTLAIVLVPTTSIGFPGIYSHKNTLGSNAALAGIFMLYGIFGGTQRMRYAGLVLLPLSALLLYISESKTALMLFVLVPFLGLGVALIRRYLRLAAPVLILLVMIPSVFVVNGTLTDFDVGDISMTVSGERTFTGRTGVWEFAGQEIAKQPLLGHGYRSFWHVGKASPAAALPESFAKYTGSAHNGYIDLMLEGGMVLLVLFLAALFMVAWWTDRVGDNGFALGLLMTVLLLYFLGQNLLETTWLEGFSASGMLMSLMILFAALHRGRARIK